MWPVPLEEEGFMLKWDEEESLFQVDKKEIGGDILRDE